MRREELAHLELPLGLGVFVVAAVIATPQVMQPPDTGIAVVDALRRNGVLARIYAEEYLLVYLLPFVRGDLLGYDGVHDCLFNMVIMSKHGHRCRYPCLLLSVTGTYRLFLV